jgi:hypothetical protein
LPPIHDDYSRASGAADYDSRNAGPANKRQRVDMFNDGHWASAPTDRHGGGGGNGGGGGGNYQSSPSQMSHRRGNPNDSQSLSNANAMVDESLDQTLTAARHGVSPFFQTATDEEMRGFNRTLRVFQK